MAAKPLLYLIDGSSQMYRAYHAPIRTNEGGLLRNAQGRPTNAVYIFVTMLRKLLNEQKPMVHAACEALGVPVLTSERYEADDVIGTLTEQAVAARYDVAIVTSD